MLRETMEREKDMSDEEQYDFYTNNCKIETKKILPNDNSYVIDVNVKRKRSDKIYIKSIEDITFDGNTKNIDELINYIAGFFREKLNVSCQEI